MGRNSFEWFVSDQQNLKTFDVLTIRSILVAFSYWDFTQKFMVVSFYAPLLYNSNKFK